MDAIQQDVDHEVSEEKEVEAESPVVSQHESEIERIAQMVQEGVIRDEEEEHEAPPVPEQDFGNPLIKKSDEWYVTAKVNGEEKDVLWNDVLTQYQKNSSADKRLQEASERQRELEEYESKLNAYRSHLETQARQPSSDAGEDEGSPSGSDATDALYEQYHDALFQGDETKASGLLKKIRAADRPSTPQIDVNSIIERTKAEMREEEKQARERGYETRRQSAVKMFHDEYPDIAGDPSLLAVADRRSAELYADNPTRDPWDIMQECADYSRTWLNSYVEKLGGEPAEVSRTQRKQNMDEVVPRNVKASIGEDEEVQTYSDIIAQMKQERGQPT